jgi:undecaprenyl-diphosphatase
MTKSRTAGIYVAISVVLFAGLWWLGLYVKTHGEPAGLWAFARSVRGHGIWVAWAFTNAGYAKVLAPLYALCVVIAIFSRPWRSRALYALVSGLLAWGAADGLQRLFARPRRTDWLIRHEHAFSYPSSHATISTAFYLLAGVLILRSELPRWLRYVAFAVLGALWFGILWSRVALAAHYASDVIGGVCLGMVIALLGAAFIRLGGGRLTES